MGGAPNPRRELGVLLVAGAALFTANSGTLSLPALDDCFYARKGVEMSRHGGFFTVTWNERPTFQNPPLQIWLVGRSIASFGENDFAARLPSIVMAVVLLLGVYRVGCLTVGGAAGLCGVALLLISPYFLNNARRCMMEVPLAFWVLVAIWVFVEGMARPRLHLTFGLPLGAAILTKSVLGLLPLVIVTAAATLLPSFRLPFRHSWIWLGTLAGLLIGASWTLDQYATFGPTFLEEHYGREIVGRAAERGDPWSVVSSYPRALLTSYQPVILPALAGAIVLWRRRRDSPRAEANALLVVWAALPVLLYSLSSARSPRYLFPVFPPLALCAGDFITARWPRVSGLLRKGVAPALVAAGALVYWVWPGLLGRSGTAVFKQDQQVRARVPPGEPLTFLASSYDWGLANPMLYYSERLLEAPTPTGAQAVALAKGRSSRLLLVERGRLPDLGEAAHSPVLLAGRTWLLLDLEGGGSSTPRESSAPSLTPLTPAR